MRSKGFDFLASNQFNLLSLLRHKCFACKEQVKLLMQIENEDGDHEDSKGMDNLNSRLVVNVAGDKGNCICFDSSIISLLTKRKFISFFPLCLTEIFLIARFSSQLRSVGFSGAVLLSSYIWIYRRCSTN